MDKKELLDYYGSKIQSLDASIGEYYCIVHRKEEEVKKLSSQLEIAMYDVDLYTSQLKTLEKERSVMESTLEQLKETN